MSDGTQVLVFFVLAATLFPFGVGPEASLLARIASGVVWVTALLAAMLSLDRLFLSDFEDGTLDQMALSDTPLAFLVLAKVAAHWLLTGLPLLLAAPVLAVMLNIDAELLPVLIATAGKGSVTLPMADFWAGLQTAIKPPLPAMLSFSRERLTLPPVAGGHSFDQVRGCPDNDAAVEWYWELGKRRLWWCL